MHIIPTHVSPLPEGPADGQRCLSWVTHIGLCFLLCLHPFCIYPVACHVESNFITLSFNSSQTPVLLLFHIIRLELSHAPTLTPLNIYSYHWTSVNHFPHICNYQHVLPSRRTLLGLPMSILQTCNRPMRLPRTAWTFDPRENSSCRLCMQYT